MAKDRKTKPTADATANPGPHHESPAPALAFPALAEWGALPDIGLYMDQVITYLERQLAPSDGGTADAALTPSMINNYIKGKVLPRSAGKKYGQDHLARLLVVGSLKRVLSIPELAVLLNGADSEWGDIEDFYELFRRTRAESLASTGKNVKETLRDVPPGAEATARRNLALKLAVQAGILALAAERLLSGVAATKAGTKPPASPSS